MVENTTPHSPVVLRQLSSDYQITVGGVGDHPLVSHLLVQACQTPQAEDFQSRLDEPSYQPTDRLLLKRKDQLIGHVQISKLIHWFQGQRCACARFQDFFTLPEYRTGELDEPLLELAESVARQEGSLLAMIRTDRPEWFESQGWSSCRGQGHTRANTRAILAHVDPPRHKSYDVYLDKTPAIEIRTWRHVELEHLQSLYTQLATGSWGAQHRTTAYWQWLVGRKAHDQILIAIEKKKDPDLLSPSAAEENRLAEAPRVVGYAVIRDSCIVEMLTLPGYAGARTQLVAQACRDAIDRDHHFVSLHTPAADPLHELLVTAGGSWISNAAHTRGHWMLKLLAPERWVDRIYPVLHERARESDVPRPVEINLAVGDCHQRLTLTRRSARLERLAVTPPSDVQCPWQTWQDLLLSNLTFSTALARDCLRIQHAQLLPVLGALFPPKLFWLSPYPFLRL